MKVPICIAAAVCLASVSAPAAAEVGAMAYSPSTDEISSASLNIFSLREVQIKVLENCSADDCQIVMTFDVGECAAVASSDKHYGVGRGLSQSEAESGAMESCAHGGADPNCHAVGWHCAKE